MGRFWGLLLVFAAACGAKAHTPPSQQRARPDGGLEILDRPDAGPRPVDAGQSGGDGGGPGVSTCSGALDGLWGGTFTGTVWLDSNPGGRQIVEGTLSFDLSCRGQKYAVSGTMTGQENQGTTFNASIVGEVKTVGTDVVFNAGLDGGVSFWGTFDVPFVGEMDAVYGNNRFENGQWVGRSTSTVLAPASGSGTWEAMKQ